jgi:hypothetical protein
MDMEGSGSGMIDTEAVGDTMAGWFTSSWQSLVDDRLARVTRDHGG